MINLFSKTYDVTKIHKFINKNTWFYKNAKFVTKKWKGVISEKMKAKTCFADKDFNTHVSSWTGLGRSGHVRSQSFGPISHASGPKLSS